MLLLLEPGGLLVAGRAGPESGSRWSARSEARTNDLDAGEDWRMLVPQAQLGVGCGWT